MKTKIIAVLLILVMAMSLMLTGCQDDEFDDSPIKLTMEVYVPSGKYSIGSMFYEQVERNGIYELPFAGKNPDIKVKIKYKKQDVTAKVKDLIRISYKHEDSNQYEKDAIQSGRYAVSIVFNQSIANLDERYNSANIHFNIIIG